MEKENKSRARLITQVAIMAAVICILGPLSVPIGVIPVSLTPFAVFLTVYLLGRRLSTASYLIYLLIGLVGVPVFSGFTGGPQKLFGPTGGYLVSFALMAEIAGFFIDKYRNVAVQYLGCLAGLVCSYFFGTVWLAFEAHLSLWAATQAAVLPFIGFDLIKIALALAIGKPVKSALMQAHILKTSSVSSS